MPAAARSVHHEKHVLTRNALTTQFAASDGFTKILTREREFKTERLTGLHKELQFKSRIWKLENPPEGPVRQPRASADECCDGVKPRHAGMAAVAKFDTHGTAGKHQLRLPLDIHGNVLRPLGTSCGRLNVSLAVAGQAQPHPARTLNDKQVLDLDDPARQPRPALFKSASSPQMTMGSLPSPRFRRPGRPFRGQHHGMSQSWQSDNSDGTERIQSLQQRRSSFMHEDVPKPSTTGSSRGFTKEALAPTSEFLPYPDEEQDLLNDLDQLNAETETKHRLHISDTPEVSRRLGGIMARLGNRYKTTSKDLIRDRALHGEIGVIKKRLNRKKELGVLNVNPLDDLVEDPDIALVAMEPDEDGDSRSRWIKNRGRNINPPLAFLMQLGLSEREATESLRAEVASAFRRERAER